MSDLFYKEILVKKAVMKKKIIIKSHATLLQKNEKNYKNYI